MPRVPDATGVELLWALEEICLSTWSTARAPSRPVYILTLSGSEIA